VLHEGDSVTLRIIKIDPENHRIGLSLRRVDSQAYADLDWQSLEGVMDDLIGDVVEAEAVEEVEAEDSVDVVETEASTDAVEVEADVETAEVEAQDSVDVVETEDSTDAAEVEDDGEEPEQGQ
jgi:small subunit ribosomal protein S1